MGQFSKVQRWKRSEKGSERVWREFHKEGRREERYYHWYDEPDTIWLTVDLEHLRRLAESKIEGSAYEDIYSFIKGKGLSEREQKLYERWMKMEQGIVAAGDLKSFCKQFNIDLKELEQRRIILQPCNYPLDMMSEAFLKVKTHILNEGSIVNHRLKYGHYRTRYNNQDPVLIKYFIDAVRGVDRALVKKPGLKDYSICVYTNPVLGRVLSASGLPSGRKTITNPSLDPLLIKHPNIARYHIQATLTEEGWVSLDIKGRQVVFEIAYGRAVDITDKLSIEQIEQLRRMEQQHEWKIPIGSIKDPQILNVIYGEPPEALRQELALLKEFHPGEKWPKLCPTRVHVSREGRATSFWEIHVSRPELVDLIHDEYGMLPGTWKGERFEKLYSVYVKYRGRKLAEEEVEEIEKVKKENPTDISLEWISQKMQELFPDVGWGKDVEKIRRQMRKKE